MSVHLPVSGWGREARRDGLVDKVRVVEEDAAGGDARRRRGGREGRGDAAGGQLSRQRPHPGGWARR